MSERTFTLEEAHDLLPILESLLRTAIQSKKDVTQIDKEFEEIDRRNLTAPDFDEPFEADGPITRFDANDKGI